MVVGQSWWEYTPTVQGHIPMVYFMLLDRGYVCVWFYTFSKHTSINSPGINLKLLPSALIILTQFLSETSAVDVVCRNMVKGCSFQMSICFPKYCEIFLWLYKSKYKKAPFPWHNTGSMLPTFKQVIQPLWKAREDWSLPLLRQSLAPPSKSKTKEGGSRDIKRNYISRKTTSLCTGRDLLASKSQAYRARYDLHSRGEKGGREGTTCSMHSHLLTGPMWFL